MSKLSNKKTDVVVKSEFEIPTQSTLIDLSDDFKSMDDSTDYDAVFAAMDMHTTKTKNKKGPPTAPGILPPPPSPTSAAASKLSEDDDDTDARFRDDDFLGAVLWGAHFYRIYSEERYYFASKTLKRL